MKIGLITLQLIKGYLYHWKTYPPGRARKQGSVMAGHHSVHVTVKSRSLLGGPRDQERGFHARTCYFSKNFFQYLLLS